MEAEPSKTRGGVPAALHRARHPNREHMERLSQRVPYWFLVVALLGFASFQIWMNPFGFSDLVQRYAQDISELLITGPYLYPTTGRDQVSVALIDEDTLHALDMPWPWTYGQHARALEALRAYKPKAVIVDFLFVDTRPDDTLPELVEEIHRYRDAHIPLYFEGGTELPFGEFPLRPELAATGVPVLDPSILIYDGVARQYPAEGKCLGAKANIGAPCKSLALQVYSDVYPAHRLAPLNGRVELVWGTRTNPFNAKWLRLTGEDGEKYSCDRGIGGLRRIYLAFFDTSQVRSLCPYATEVPVQSLMMGTDDPDFPKLIPGHVILYGASLQGAQDKSYTPVNGLTPSVFVHAMALDNLITFDGRPQQNVVSIGAVTLASNPVQIIAVVPVILILAWFHLRGVRRKRAPEGKRDFGAAFEYFVEKAAEKLWHWFAFALALGAGLILTLASGLSVANWVEVVFVSAELAALLLVSAPDALWGYLHHVAGGDPQTKGDVCT